MAIERLKLAVFCLKIYERTDRKLPEMTILDCCNLSCVEDQQRIEDDYFSSKDSGPELKPMSIDVHSAPACFDKFPIILNSMRGCTGIPLTYVIRLNLLAKDWKRDLRFGMTGSSYGSIDKELVARAPIIVHNCGSRTPEELKESGPFTSAFSTDMKKVYLVLYSILGANSSRTQGLAGHPCTILRR